MSVGIEKLSKILIFGNSGSGKSILAKKICTESVIPHLALDTVAWLPTNPPERKSIAESYSEIQQFINRKDSWVIEGCYSEPRAIKTNLTAKAIIMFCQTMGRVRLAIADHNTISNNLKVSIYRIINIFNS